MRGSIVQTLAAVAGLVLLGYGLVILFVFFSQKRLLYFPDLPSRKVGATPAAIGLDFQEVWLTCPDTTRLHGWYIPGPAGKGMARTLLFCHGNAGNISHRLDSIRIFHNLGLAQFIFDYRGYGRSQGVVSEPGTYMDAETAWHYLVQERGVAPGQIILFGRSLGGAVAAHLASLHPVTALILESTFTSIPDLAAELYPLLPVRWLSRYRYNTLSRLVDISCPILVIHSREDEIIPFSHGRQLSRASGTSGQLLEIRGGHNDGFLLSGQEYSNGLARFLEKVAAAPP